MLREYRAGEESVMKKALLENPQNTIDVLQKYQFTFHKRFGQNFLIDPHVLDKIISSAEITKEDAILEIGPGIGTMTQALSEAAGKVIAVEIDRHLMPILKETLEGYDNVRIIWEDILKVDIGKLVKEENGNQPIKVVANLPYNITTPVILGLLRSHAPINSITVMIQEEVADRIAAKAGTKEYGALTLAVNYYAVPYIVAYVPPNCFIPRPKVGSAVVRLTLREKPPVAVDNEELLFSIIRASFNQRRKTLVNGLYNASNLNFSKEDIRKAIKSLGKEEGIRGETLSLEEFADLSNYLNRKEE